MLYCHTIFWGAEGLGEGCVKIMLIVSCLEWLACLFLFIMVEFEKLLYSPDLKMVLIFLVTKVFQKGTLFKWVYVSLSHERQRRRQGSMVAWVCAATPSPQKKLLLGSLVKIAFPRFLLFTTITYVWATFFCFTCRLKIEVALSVRQYLLVGANVKGKMSANSLSVSEANYSLSNTFEDLFKAFDKPFEWFEYPFRQLQHPFERFLGGDGETLC